MRKTRWCVWDCVGVIGRRGETAGKNYNDSETHLNHPPNQSENHTHSVSVSFPPTQAYKISSSSHNDEQDPAFTVKQTSSHFAMTYETS